MTPNNDFLDNLANDQYQKLIQEVYNDDMLKKTTKNKNNNELIERIEEEDSSEGKQGLQFLSKYKEVRPDSYPWQVFQGHLRTLVCLLNVIQ